MRGGDSHFGGGLHDKRVEEQVAKQPAFQLLHPVKAGSMFALAVFTVGCDVQPPISLLDYLVEDADPSRAPMKSSRSKE